MKKTMHLLCLLAILAVGTSLTFAQESRETRKTAHLNQGGEVNIDSFKGSITVTTWDRQEVEIYAKIEADGQSTDGKKLVQDTEVNIETSANSIRIKSNYDKIEER